MSIYSRGHFSFLGFRLKRDRGHLSHLLWFLLPVNGRLRWAQEPASSCRVSGASGVMPPPQVCQMGRSRPIQGAGGGAQVCQLGPVPLPALLTSPARRRPSRGSPGGNKRIKLPHKQIPQACGNNQRAMIVARTEGQRRRGPGVGSPGKGPSEEEFCSLWPAPQTFLPSGTSRACDLSAGIPITPRLPYSLGPALSLGGHCRNLPPFSSFHPNPSHSLDFYLWLKHHLNSTSL